MNRRILAVPVVALLATAAGLLGVTGSSATWVDTSASSSTVTAAADWTPPAVALVEPAALVQGTVTVSATASDASGIEAVALQVRTAGSTQWRTLCRAATAPYTCSWQTTSEPDGAHDLRAVATDRAGYDATSPVLRTTVANTAAVTLANPGALLRGTVPLQAAVSAPSGTSWTVRVERRSAGGPWQVVCTTASPYACSWDTRTATDGAHDLRAVATSGAVELTSAVLAVTVDNRAPTVSLAVPAGPLKGEVTVTSTASDADSGLAKVVVQVATTPTGPWQDLCAGSAATLACRIDTTRLANTNQHFRAVATDRAGNQAASAVVGPRLVDNTTRTITLADPGAWLDGVVVLTATASSTAPITSVRFQRAVRGTATWTDLCTDTAAPWSCSWDTRTVADNGYDLRAIVTDVNGNQTVSSVVADRTVDNRTTVFRGLDVQANNGPGTSGQVDAGDSLVFTFSRRVDPTSVTPGWDGSALPVRLELSNRGVISDDITVTRAGSVVNLGGIVSTNSLVSGRASLDALLVMTTEVVDGRPRSVVTVQVGELATGSVRTMLLPSNLTWSPLAALTSVGGQGISTAQVSESGSFDRDF